ncbi:MaoC/PaaZ C-terminal domain-containing protein [Mechercharimyces sp. CAU 1602]|uniref:MaoC/PaaZ C-terminal domain-containing protein n=1 Tax=Mechercharimyces sp. CAU 1602 TaxID=2973933 RepID=UPI0021618F36|nr:MaoC/PaaZ C-terminal domain-containing protein [Mechercharimyces sp. CAU 1602]MCS1350718.1 MaoC/PaaZ C-terminal domain-containing protein [Mechercharimyces sp. CAU 1602]
MNHLHHLATGESLEEIQLSPVSRLDLIKYAGASGDYNPIHTIDEEAQKLGLPGIIAHGMWSMGQLSKLFTPYYTDGFIQNYSIRFKGMVGLGDVLTLRATLTERGEERLRFKVIVVNQAEEDVLAGSIDYHLYSKAAV